MSRRGTILLLAVAATSAFIVTAFAQTSARPPDERAFILTQNSVLLADLRTSRILVSRPLASGAARKVVHSTPFVLLQRQRAVHILNARTLERAHVVEFASEVLDIAVSGSLLFVASGPQIHIVRITSAGAASRVASVRLPKPAHALATNGASVYAIDDVVTPLYVHLIDVQHPDAPRLTTFKWGEVYGHLVTQAVADRWYVLVSYTRNRACARGTYLAALPADPPLRLLERWDVGPLGEFRVHKGNLYWVGGGGDESVWLFRRRLDSRSAATEKVARLGPFVWPLPERSGIIELDGSRLYVATARTLLAFDVDPSRPPAYVTIAWN